MCILVLDSVAIAQSPALAGRFEIRTDREQNGPMPAPVTWYFWRSANQIEILDDDRGRGELWRKDKSGSVLLTKLFHPEQRAIKFYPGDLRALALKPNWERLVHIIDPQHLSADLKITGEQDVLEKKATVYRGPMAGALIEVWWLPQEDIPALIRKEYPDRTVTLRLMELYPLAQAPWPSADLSRYRFMDFADLGDHESDPFVQQLGVTDH